MIFCEVMEQGTPTSDTYYFEARSHGYLAKLSPPPHSWLYALRTFFYVRKALSLNGRNALAHYILAHWLIHVPLPFRRSVITSIWLVQLIWTKSLFSIASPKRDGTAMLGNFKKCGVKRKRL